MTPFQYRQAPAAESIYRFLFGSALRTFAALLTLWCGLLVFFYTHPHIDIAVTMAFFREAVCGEGSPAEKICGGFPVSRLDAFRMIRKVLFYLPAAAAILILILLIDNLVRKAKNTGRQTRGYAIAVISILVGPYVLVNLIFKEFSYRPRPYETAMFGGDKAFMPAGDFQGACVSNCSFVSGEAAGAGWLACLIVLVPPHLRAVVVPPLLLVSLATPMLRTVFGGHYLSDVMLGWLSSLVIFTGITALFEITQLVKKSAAKTNL